MEDPKLVAAGANAVAGALRFLFHVPAGSLPVCETKVMHDGRGFRWNAQIAVHALGDGRVETRLIRAARRRERKSSRTAAIAVVVALCAIALTLGWALGSSRIAL